MGTVMLVTTAITMIGEVRGLEFMRVRGRVFASRDRGRRFRSG
jgi:hypothetical protein